LLVHAISYIEYYIKHNWWNHNKHVKVGDDPIEVQVLNMLSKALINNLTILVTSNEKTQNYKVVDLAESYNFDIKSSSSKFV